MRKEFILHMDTSAKPFVSRLDRFISQNGLINGWIEGLAKRLASKEFAAACTWDSSNCYCYIRNGNPCPGGGYEQIFGLPQGYGYHSCQIGDTCEVNFGCGTFMHGPQC